jgi:hypothetical protein
MENWKRVRHHTQLHHRWDIGCASIRTLRVMDAKKEAKLVTS